MLQIEKHCIGLNLFELLCQWGNTFQLNGHKIRPFSKNIVAKSGNVLNQDIHFWEKRREDSRLI